MLTWPYSGLLLGFLFLMLQHVPVSRGCRCAFLRGLLPVWGHCRSCCWSFEGLWGLGGGLWSSRLWGPRPLCGLLVWGSTTVLLLLWGGVWHRVCDSYFASCLCCAWFPCPQLRLGYFAGGWSACGASTLGWQQCLFPLAFGWSLFVWSHAHSVSLAVEPLSFHSSLVFGLARSVPGVVLGPLAFFTWICPLWALGTAL